MTRALLLTLLCALVAMPRAAGADYSPPQPVVCEKILRCVEQIKLANRQAATDREAALATTQDAYRQYPDPLLCYNLGRLLHQLNRYAEAVEQYNCFLKSGVESPPERLDKARTYLEQAERELVKPPPVLPPIVMPPPPVVTPPLKVAEKPPIYKKWWFWTLVGGAAAGVAAGTAIGIAAREPDLTGVMQYRPFSP